MGKLPYLKNRDVPTQFYTYPNIGSSSNPPPIKEPNKDICDKFVMGTRQRIYTLKQSKYQTTTNSCLYCLVSGSRISYQNERWRQVKISLSQINYPKSEKGKNTIRQILQFYLFRNHPAIKSYLTEIINICSIMPKILFILYIIRKVYVAIKGNNTSAQGGPGLQLTACQCGTPTNTYWCAV